MSAIHKFRVIDSSVKERDSKEVYNYCFSYSDLGFEFPDWFERLQIDIDSSEVDFDKFFSIISENYQSKGLSAFDLIFRLYNDDFETLRQSANSENPPIVPAEALVWYHILSDLSVDGFSKIPTMELKVEIAQHEDGITAFPHIDDMNYWDEQYREFLVRLLSEVPSKDSYTFPIQNWYKENGMELYDGPLMDTNSIVWGMKEENRIRITDNSSWQKYNQFWWADLMQKNVQYKLENNGDGWLDSLEENPLEVVTVNVLMHNSWFPDIQEVVENEEVFNSTAFFVS